MSVTADLDTRPFSATLRASTKVLHERANHSRYMNALLGGEVSLAGYARLVVQYYFIYQAIERVSDRMAGDAVGGGFVFDELRRLPSLERDLAHLVGPGWRTEIQPLASTQAYAARIAEAASWAGGYVAHHYTRYLGDIAGGQIIRRLLEKKFGLGEAGTRFYHFDLMGSAPAFRDRYRAKLDAAPWGEPERERVIDETAAAFECNVAVFDELARDLDRYRVA
ncbi:biliverdin-producing heme oxygenase [Amycolatopsis sp. PS_44_ISF1]|uniref:biliverdin-producing heme oxygenase n=1 Tax=Amycolatopsis sp. PS_44_ISF1 TaxID=2974917 RepID=UPI0028DF232C|nr:biliverdin-producing heme oxygenase [Amycolatopsis sp. PS_44_ISF1]MDT8911169.1 biliverdin-producing heme oxygenase [Amycolatopsis sp. PS_44_ISF1]